MKPAATVLIVEDEANMRRVLRALLRSDGYEILEAGDGAEALARIDEHHVDVVVTDLKMPRMNGLELLEAARREHPRLPIVLLTAFGTIGSAVEALKQGAFDYLTKPFDPEEVRQVVAKAARTHALDDREASADADGDPEHLLLGESAVLQEVKRIVARVAATPATPPSPRPPAIQSSTWLHRRGWPVC